MVCGKMEGMENEIEKKENSEDEISLLDLFAVLIRYRKLIVLGTLIVSFLAGLYLFAVPLIFKKANTQQAKVAYTVSVRAIPLSIATKLPNGETITPLYLATYNAQRLPFLVDEVKKNNIFSNEEMTAYEFNSFVQSLIKNKKIEIIESKLGNEYDIQLLIPIEKIDDATKFVKSMVYDTDLNLQNYYNPLIQSLLTSTNTTIEKARSSATSDSAALQEVQNLNVDLHEFTDNFSGFLTIHEQPFVIPEGRGRVKKLIIIFLAAFFIFVFTAFCKNAVVNIKADPESNKLITDAWKAGK